MNGKLRRLFIKNNETKTIDTSHREIRNKQAQFKKILNQLSKQVGDHKFDRLRKNFFSKKNIFVVLESPHARLTELSGHSVTRLIKQEISSDTAFSLSQSPLPEWYLDGSTLLMGVHFEDEVYTRPSSYNAYISLLIKVLKKRDNSSRISGAIIYLHQNDFDSGGLPVWLNKMASFIGAAASKAEEAIPVYIVLESASNSDSPNLISTPVGMLKDKGVTTEQFTQWYGQAKEEISKRLLKKTLKDVQYVHNIESRRLAFSDLNSVEENFQQLKYISEQLNQRWNFTDKHNSPWVRGVFVAPHADEISGSAGANHWWQCFSHQLVQDRYCSVTEKPEASYKQWSIAGLITAVGMVSLFFCQLVWRDYVYASQLSDDFSEQLIPQYLNSTYINESDFKTVLSDIDGVENARKHLVERTNERTSWSSSLTRQVLDRGGIVLDDLSENILQTQFGSQLNQAIINKLEFSDDFETLYPALKSYLLFHQSKDERSDYLMWWFGQQWQIAYKNDPESRQQLAQYLSIYLKHQVKNESRQRSYKYDEDVVSTARAKMLSVPLAQRLYLQIKQEANSKLIGTGELKEIIGYRQAEVFGESSSAVSSFYTRNGYKTLFLPSLHRLLKQASTDEWVLGFAGGGEHSYDSEALKKDIYQRYISDYISAWDHFIKTLSIEKTTSLDHLSSLLKASFGNEGAIRRVLQYVYDNTAQYSIVTNELASIDPSTVPGRVATPASVNKVVSYLSEQNVASTFPMKRVAVHFDYLNSVHKNSENKSSAIDEIDAQLQQLDEYLLDFEGVGNASPNGNVTSSAVFDATVKRVNGSRNNPISQLKRTSKMMPKPLNTWATSYSFQAWSHMLYATKQHIKNVYKYEIYALYASNIKSRYPLSRKSKNDVELEHFSDYFKPEGKEQRFFNHYLKPFVRTGHKRWREIKIDGLTMGLTRNYLSQLHRAQRIRDTLFKNQNIFAELQFQPIYLDANVSRFDLELMGERLNYRHGPQKISKIIWPAEINSTDISMRFEDYNGGLATEALSGDWSLFKLIDLYGKETMSGDQRYRMSFEVNGQRAVYGVSGHSLTPEFLGILSQYRMPEKPLG